MDDAACPKCKSTKYRNPSMKLMVNVCGHGLCESCVELLFVKGIWNALKPACVYYDYRCEKLPNFLSVYLQGSGSCPECNIPLRRANFRLQLFEDSSVDKEIEIRRRVFREFNKTEEDFLSLSEFSDYQVRPN